MHNMRSLHWNVFIYSLVFWRQTVFLRLIENSKNVFCTNLLIFLLPFSQLQFANWLIVYFFLLCIFTRLTCVQSTPRVFILNYWANYAIFTNNDSHSHSRKPNVYTTTDARSLERYKNNNNLFLIEEKTKQKQTKKKFTIL